MIFDLLCLWIPCDSLTLIRPLYAHNKPRERKNIHDVLLFKYIISFSILDKGLSAIIELTIFGSEFLSLPP